jgi:hypothetical protein
MGFGRRRRAMPILEDALSVPVFAPAEAPLALARGAALASAQNVDFAFTDEPQDSEERRSLAHRRRRLGQTGPLALLVAGVLTFTVSASVAVSLQLAPKRDAATSEPRPAAKISPETPAAPRTAPSRSQRHLSSGALPGPPRRGSPAAGLRDAVDIPGRRWPLRRATGPGPPTRGGRGTSAAGRCAITARAAGPARRACAGRPAGNRQPDQGPAARHRQGRRGVTRS